VRSPDPGLIERFARDWRTATGGQEGPALVALSGGADSSALLLLMAALGRRGTAAATVDHGIRPAAAAEARHAADLAHDCGIVHTTLSGPLPERVGGTANLSARARVLRYRLLEEHAAAIGARWIATAHHADDQLETMVMRLARGAGLRGLAGVRVRQGMVVRPLLGWRRAELGALVADRGIVPVDDPSNVDDRFDRARLRKRLADAGWFDPLAASRSAGALAEAEEAIAWMVDRLVAERGRFGEDEASVQAGALPGELRRRLVERCLAHVDPAIAPRGDEVGRTIARLSEGGSGTLGGVRYGVDGQGGWTFRKAPPRRSHRSA
jgi:tRNA(Ile)-lysidine synthase